MFNSMFTSDEIIHNGGAACSPTKTCSASFSVSDWKFMPAHTQPRLTFQPRALIQRGGPTKEGWFFVFFLTSSAGLKCVFLSPLCSLVLH